MSGNAVLCVLWQASPMFDVLQAHTANMASHSAISKALGADAAEPATIHSTNPHDTGKCYPQVS